MADPWDFEEVWATECNDYPTFEGSICMDVTSACVNIAASVFTGLGHLEGETVSILADGIVQESQVVVDGQISLPASAGVVHVGLPYYSDLETLDIDITEERDTVKARKIKVGNVNIGSTQSHGGWIGEDEASIYEAFTEIIIGQNRSDLELSQELTTLNAANVLYDGIIRRPLNAKWRHGGKVFFRQKDPKPVHITSIAPEISVGGPS